jgi:hypothetical protein
MTYAEKLRDPRWQKKRLEILNRDGFACRLCGDKETELHIHHEKYNGNPWDAKNDDLSTLCKHCHILIEKLKKEGHRQNIEKVTKRIEHMYDDRYSVKLYVKMYYFVMVYSYCDYRNTISRDYIIDPTDFLLINSITEWQDL